MTGGSLADYAEAALDPLVPARHHRAMMQALEELTGTAGGRLMLQMPPGHGKSIYGSMLYPAWWFTRHPRSSVIMTCHTQELATHFGRGIRGFANERSDLLGYGFARDNKAAHRFTTTTGGEFFATGLGGGITGRRADLVLIDDPIKSHDQADSAAHRDAVWDWYRSELVSRLKPGGRIVLIMTRWHTDDFAGRLLATGEDWRALRWPALAEAGDPLGRRPGEALWPDWEDAAALAAKRLVVGERVWSALYQQAPRPDAGSLFPVARIGVVDAAPEGLRCVRAWDLAATEAGPRASGGRDPDWTVGVKLGRDAAGRVLVTDMVRLRQGPGAVTEAILRTAAADGPGVAVGLPQDPGQAGKQQVAWLTGQLAGHRVVASPESGAKLTRAMPVAAQAEAGTLLLLRAPWNAALLDELRDFPTGRHDDQVDALARGFAMLDTKGAMAGATAGRRLYVPLMAR